MKDFEFYNPVRIVFGKKQLEKISDLIPLKKRIMLLYGGGSIKKNGVYEGIMKALEDCDIIEFKGIEPNPSYETCMKAVDLIKKENVEFLLAAGGGSVIDATKFIAAAALYDDGDPWDILAKGSKIKASLPLADILTLPATGTEMNKNSVISRQSTNEKLAFSSPHSFPQFSVLLPDAAATLPTEQVANGVVDAFVHVIEQYLTYPVNAPLQDRIAEAILTTLIEEGPKAYADPSDYDSMANLMWSATMALNGIIKAGVPEDWSVHDIGHELTALHNIDHARTLAIVLPGVWRVLREEKKEKLLQYGERIWGITQGTEEERVDRAIDVTVKFFESLGIKTKFSDYGIPAETIDRIVERFKKRGCLFGMGDRKLVTLPVVRKILEDRL
ncbi:MAG TPA: iron-containing alcohol dehydrogenase [Bacteroidetes bacterium]|nr:iron-containing alcohol dehydrogenase [Bacteroidota bacterium]